MYGEITFLELGWKGKEGIGKGWKRCDDKLLK